jgi:hypothetical protein
VYALIHVGKLALDEKQNLIPHCHLELDRAQLPILVAKGPAACEGDEI